MRQCIEEGFSTMIEPGGGGRVACWLAAFYLILAQEMAEFWLRSLNSQNCASKSIRNNSVSSAKSSADTRSIRYRGHL